MTRGIPDHQDQPHGVYTIHAETTGEVLYVGMSRDPDYRIYMHHLEHSHWTHEPYVIEVAWCVDRAEARAVERAQILALNPRDNKQHRPTGRPNSTCLTGLAEFHPATTSNP